MYAITRVADYVTHIFTLDIPAEQWIRTLPSAKSTSNLFYTFINGLIAGLEELLYVLAFGVQKGEDNVVDIGGDE